MAQLSLSIDTRTIKNGGAHIRLRINHCGTSAFVSIGVYIEPQYFIPKSLYDPFHRKAPLAAEKREKVAAIVRQVDEFIMSLSYEELHSMTAQDIRERSGVFVKTRKSGRVSSSDSGHTEGSYFSSVDNGIERRQSGYASLVDSGRRRSGCASIYQMSASSTIGIENIIEYLLCLL